MRYRISQEFIRNRKRSMFICICLYVVVSMVLVLAALASKNFFMLIGLLFLVMAWQTYSYMKKWSTYAQKIQFSIEESNLMIQGDSFKTKMSLYSIKRMILQVRRKKISSLLLCTDFGAPQKIEGVSDIQALAQEIERVIGGGKVKKVRFVHS